jgi:hypothetical protein
LKRGRKYPEETNYGINKANEEHALNDALTNADV